MSDVPSFDLTGSTALVTGARRGIGMAIAVALAAHGADIIGVSASQPESGSEVGDLVERHGRGFVGRSCDFSDRSATTELAAWLTATQPPIDILVNNAGTSSFGPATEVSDDTWDEIVEVNLSAPLVLTRELAGPMLERGRGKIIFTSSILGFRGGVGVAAYTATKTALLGVTKALSNEWAPHGVNVNAIAPGYIETDLTRGVRDDPGRAQATMDRIPAGRWGVPSDLGGAVVFLASGASDYVHGTVIAVDGGWLGR